MKKIMYFAAALLMFAGCRSSQEARENAPAEVGTITGTIALPQEPNKIIAPDDWKSMTKFTMKWETGDEIYIYNASGCKELILKSIDKKTSKAMFEGELLSDMESYSVAYGYDPNSTEKTFAVPYVAGNYRPFADGTGAEKAFTISNFGPVLGLKLKGEDALSKIEVVLSDNSETLATYTMSFSTALALNTTNATNVYFPIKSKEGATKMDISFYKKESSADKLIMTKTTTSITQVAAGKVTTFKELTVAEPFVPTYVDLGLPSGLKWATCNVGATNPEDYGDYFAWGETEPYYNTPLTDPVSWKTEYPNGYAWQSYCGQSTFKEWSPAPFDADTKILTPAYDAAAVNWGGAWRMPTEAEFQELLDNCYNSWTTQNGVNGRLFTSKKEGYTDKSIFLPAAGYFDGTSLYYAGSYGDYWSSSRYADDSLRGRRLYFLLGEVNMYIFLRYYGLSVRPVCE